MALYRLGSIGSCQSQMDKWKRKLTMGNRGLQGLQRRDWRAVQKMVRHLRAPAIMKGATFWQRFNLHGDEVRHQKLRLIRLLEGPRADVELVAMHFSSSAQHSLYNPLFSYPIYVYVYMGMYICICGATETTV